MPRLIDADALEKILMAKGLARGYFTRQAVINEIKFALTIEAEPVRHGRWVDRYGDKYDNHLYECSECKGKARYRFVRDELGKEIAEQAFDDYCPHCGAKMDGNT